MSGSTRQSRELKKWLAARRAQFRLKQSFELIDFNEDILNPEVEALLSGRVRLEIEPGNTQAARSIIQITVEEDDATSRDTGS